MLTLKGNPQIPLEAIRRVSIEQYHSMIEAGIFNHDDQIELLSGWVINKMSKNPPHAVITGILFELLLKLLPPYWFVQVEGPITLTDSEPEPDIAIVRGKRIDYYEQHPTGADVALVIEVADSSLQRDRILKKAIYAAAGIPIYWIVNLQDQQIEVYQKPLQTEEPDYGERLTYPFDHQVGIEIEGQRVGTINLSDHLPAD